MQPAACAVQSRWTIGRAAGRSAESAVGGEREGHADLGPAAGAVVDLEALRHLRDQREAQAEAGAVGAREHPAALVRHLDDDRLRLAARAHLDRPGLVAVQVGVQHGVGDRLGDGERDGGERIGRRAGGLRRTR